MSDNLKIGVLCFYFPPFNSVGGKRWHKFSYYFNQLGFPLTIIAENPEPYNDNFKIKEWEDDSSYKIYRLKSGYPSLIVTGPKNIWQKILYRFQIKKLRKIINGNIYDPSSLWDKKIDEIEKIIIENNLNVIIVSGAPFAYMYYCLNLKKKFPELKLVADFRDLWADSKLGYGQHIKNFQGISNFEVEVQRQKEVLAGFNHIVTVSNDIAEIISKYFKNDNKITIIPNGFDPREGMFTPYKKSRTEKLKFLYIGTVNCGHSYYMKFIDALIKLNKENPSLFRILEFEFIGNDNKEFLNQLQKCNFKNIKISDKKPIQNIINDSENVDVLLYFKMEDNLNNSFATKFFDYLRLRIPILILSPEGDVTNYIQSKNIGYVLDQSNVYGTLTNFILEYDKILEKFNVTSNFEEFNVKYISNKFVDVLKLL